MMGGVVPKRRPPPTPAAAAAAQAAAEAAAAIAELEFGDTRREDELDSDPTAHNADDLLFGVESDLSATEYRAKIAVLEESLLECVQKGVG
jgi:hypothetical protein